MNAMKFGDDYHHHFDPEWYLETYYKELEQPDEPGLLKFILDTVHQLSKQIPSEFLDNVMEFGTGPTIHIATIMSARASNIYLTEFAQPNRTALQKWLDGKSTHDWSALMGYIGRLEGSSSLGLEDRTRPKIRGVYSSDIRKEHIVPELSEKRFGTVVSALCIEATVLSLEDYKRAFEKLHSVLRPGGYLLLIGLLEESFYRVGDHKFAHLRCSRETMEKTATSSGFNIIKITTCEREAGGDIENVADYDACYGLLAQKLHV